MHVALKGGAYRKLMGMLVDSVLLYGAEVWGCCRQIQAVEQVQLKGFRVFLGANRLHPRTSLEMEMDLLPVVWAAKKRCMDFWFKVLQMKPERLISSIAKEVLEKGSKIKWLADLRKTLKELGWGNIVGMELENMSEGERGQMMDSVVSGGR